MQLDIERGAGLFVRETESESLRLVPWVPPSPTILARMRFFMRPRDRRRRFCAGRFSYLGRTKRPSLREKVVAALPDHGRVAG
jgi:hypothetical protein